ncbi:MAG: coproporphyrinogen III oxidase [Hyphomicrobiaceae bacterium]|nr:coproporphyrinogen III oxidase [Hyphomicrobiaceae bacterium]
MAQGGKRVSAQAPGFGIYIHWPFCAQKCPYCDFNSHVRMKGVDEARMVAAYRSELEYCAEISGRDAVVTSIFLGGGTPSLMQPETVAATLDHVAANWHIAADAEITLEANPGSVEAGRFAGYRTAGVNRVSLGLQALNDGDLRRLGRIHTVEEAKTALAIAQRTFERSSFDLIYARPGQSIEAWREELGEALAMAGEHLSLYQLTIEDGTPYSTLHKAGRLVIPDPEQAHALYELTQEMTEAAGWPAYEISNHARAGAESRHNLTYWRYGPYVGIGAGAHGRLRRASDDASIATATERNPEAWRDAVERHGHGFIEQTQLSAAEQADEMLLMGLRIAEGVDLRRLQALTNHRPDWQVIAELESQGLLVASPRRDRISTTPAGRIVLDWIVTRVSQGLSPVPFGHLPVV